RRRCASRPIGCPWIPRREPGFREPRAAWIRKFSPTALLPPAGIERPAERRAARHRCEPESRYRWALGGDSPARRAWPSKNRYRLSIARVSCDGAAESFLATPPL